MLASIKREAQSRLCGKQPTLVRNAWVVQLADSGLIKDVMYAKHKFTRLCTRDINVTGLRQEVIDNISSSKIFINEMLSKDKFIQFKCLKAVARGLKFKYFWHRGGRFLAKFPNHLSSISTFTFIIPSFRHC